MARKRRDRAAASRGPWPREAVGTPWSRATLRLRLVWPVRAPDRAWWCRGGGGGAAMAGDVGAGGYRFEPREYDGIGNKVDGDQADPSEPSTARIALCPLKIDASRPARVGTWVAASTGSLRRRPARRSRRCSARLRAREPPTPTPARSAHGRRELRTLPRGVRSVVVRPEGSASSSATRRHRRHRVGRGDRRKPGLDRRRGCCAASGASERAGDLLCAEARRDGVLYCSSQRVWGECVGRQACPRAERRDARADLELVAPERDDAERYAGGERFLRDAHAAVADDDRRAAQQRAVRQPPLQTGVGRGSERPGIMGGRADGDPDRVVSEGEQRCLDERVVVLELA